MLVSPQNILYESGCCRNIQVGYRLRVVLGECVYYEFILEFPQCRLDLSRIFSPRCEAGRLTFLLVASKNLTHAKGASEYLLIF
jgi:hypothetical protein